MSTIGLVQRCLDRGARFSLDAEAGILVAGDDVLEPGDFEMLTQHVGEIAELLRAERRRRVRASDLAVLAAEQVVREYADRGSTA